MRKVEGEGFSYVLGVLRKADNTVTQATIQTTSPYAGQQEQLQFSWPGILYTSEYVTEQTQKEGSVNKNIKASATLSWCILQQTCYATFWKICFVGLFGGFCC